MNDSIGQDGVFHISYNLVKIKILYGEVIENWDRMLIRAHKQPSRDTNQPPATPWTEWYPGGGSLKESMFFFVWYALPVATLQSSSAFSWIAPMHMGWYLAQYNIADQTWVALKFSKWVVVRLAAVQCKIESRAETLRLMNMRRKFINCGRILIDTCQVPADVFMYLYRNPEAMIPHKPHRPT